MAQQMDTLSLKDGTSMDIVRLPEVDDKTWAEVKSFLEENPENAKGLQAFSRHPEAVRSWMQTRLIMSYYDSKMQKKEGDTTPNPLEAKFKALAEDPEFAPLVKEIKTGGVEAMLKMYQDQELLLKFNEKMGGLPDDLGKQMQMLAQRPMTLHEAAKRGDLDTCKDYITKQNQAGVSIDVHDPNGITALGFAIGADRSEIVKLLMSCKANPDAVDAKGNTGAHYAAGYGRQEMLKVLLAAKSDPSKKNGDGKSPLDVATQNNMQPTVEILKQAGAQ